VPYAAIGAPFPVGRPHCLGLDAAAVHRAHGFKKEALDGRGQSASLPAAAPPATAYIPPSRRTKRTFTTWQDGDALKQLRHLAERKRIPQQKLIAEPLNLLFEKHGLPPIAS
jgi:hypothetical protein